MHRFRPAAALLLSLLLTGAPALSAAENTQAGANPVVPLEVQTGTPLRLYLTRRVSFRRGQPVQAKVADPVWAFDRIVVPAGSVLQGEVVDNRPVDKMTRALSIIRGDLTPLKHSYVRFTSLAIPGQPVRSLDTLPSVGLNSFYDPNHVTSKQATAAVSPATRSARIKAFVKQQVGAQKDRGRSFLAAVRGPNKMEWVENFLWTKLPYHPQWYRTGTRFDAVLNQPLSFGTLPNDVHLENVGTMPGTDTAASIRFLSEVNSRLAKTGDPVEAVLSQPVFSGDRKLLLPEGTLLHGKVTTARRARYFHRSGQLRFVFNQMDPPFLLHAPAERENEHIQAQLTGAESGSSPVKVDNEGNVKTTESKARFIRPLIAGFVASRAADNDLDKHAGAGTVTGTAGGNYGGRALGGFSGFGLFGTLTTLGPRAISTGLGYYGLACSVFSTVVSRGKEVIFEKNSAMSVRFGAAR